ncbi:MAG TPA: EAL domain-containing protein [Burkholderiaceae bacterium]|nr:EAL domain-containing protein [Burkholderiaceae bacterium]
MASPPEGAPARHPRRLRIDALEGHGRALLVGGGRPAMLAIGLSRSDRARALANRDDAVRVLVDVLDRIEATLRPADRYAVVAVDEIWVILADAGSEAIVRLAAGALVDAVSGRYDGRLDDGTPRPVGVRARAGGVWLDGPGTPSDAFAELAARALATARRHDEPIEIVPATHAAPAIVRRHATGRVRRAIETNAVELWFQPQVRLADRRCDAVEGLLRWEVGDGGPPIPPGEVAAIAEECGLIGELTRVGLHQALRAAERWSARGIDARIGLNLSPRVLDEAGLPELVEQACALWGASPERLTFELTEGSVARRPREAIALMERLRELGCGLAIDDFGTGYSSFASLRRFPVDELKIDRGFVLALAHDATDRRVVQAMVDIAHAFGLRAVAEGVEDAASVEVLGALGCDLVQGWHFAKAMPADEAADWIADFNAARDLRAAAPASA